MEQNRNTRSATEVQKWQGSGGSWAYERYGGRGPLVVMVHGMMFDHRIWQPVATELARDHNVIAVDLPGHGQSPKRDQYSWPALVDELAALAGDQPGGPPVIVGHSAAALLATAYAAEHPARAVVNVDQPLDIAGFATRLRQIGPDPDEATFNQLSTVLIDSMHLDTVPGPFRGLVNAQPRRDVMMGWQQPLLDRQPQEIQDWVEDLLRRVTVPYLAIFSREPWPGHDDWLRDRTGDARTEVYRCPGHFPHLADVDRFAASIRDLSAAGA